MSFLPQLLNTTVPELEHHTASSAEPTAPTIKASTSSVEKFLFWGDVGSPIQEP